MTSQPGKNGGRRLKKQPSGWLRAIIMMILALIMVLMATVCVLYRVWVKKPMLPSDGHLSTIVSGHPAVDLQAVQPKVAGMRKSADFYTILVVGEDTASDHTDTMMLVSYDATNQKTTVMSLPRDTLINMRSTSVYTRLNTVYAAYGKGEAGMNALTREVAELVGFVPDYRVLIDWQLVGQMVEALGGVEYDVPFHMEYYDPDQDLNIYIEKGVQRLNGDQAMKLVRWRKNNPGVEGGGDGSDLNRLQVQHGFLQAVLRQTLQFRNVTKISELSKLFGDNVRSDLTIENLFWFASQAIFGGLTVDDVAFTTMPVEIYKAYVYPNQEELLALINTGLNPFVDEVTLEELDLISVNQDGSLRSTSGVLADPDAAQPQVGS